MENFDIGAIIKKSLKLKGLTQSELARRMGVERAVISRWCNNKSTPDANTFLQIARILDIKLDEIVRPYLSYEKEQKLIKIYDDFKNETDRQDVISILKLIQKITGNTSKSL